jgi:hypothetical protein
LQDAINLLEAKAQYDGTQVDVFTRLGEHDGNIYIDLVNNKWEVIKISKSGYEITSNPDVRFIRSSGMDELPYPIKNGDIKKLTSFLNISNDTDFKLIVSWITQSANPKGPYPIFSTSQMLIFEVDYFHRNMETFKS